MGKLFAVLSVLLVVGCADVGDGADGDTSAANGKGQAARIAKLAADAGQPVELEPAPYDPEPVELEPVVVDAGAALIPETKTGSDAGVPVVVDAAVAPVAPVPAVADAGAAAPFFANTPLLFRDWRHGMIQGFYIVFRIHPNGREATVEHYTAPERVRVLPDSLAGLTGPDNQWTWEENLPEHDYRCEFWFGAAAPSENESIPAFCNYNGESLQGQADLTYQFGKQL